MTSKFQGDAPEGCKSMVTENLTSLNFVVFRRCVRFDHFSAPMGTANVNIIFGSWQLTIC